MLSLWVLIIWAVLGVIFISTMENNNTDSISIKKAIILIFVSGPVMWLYTLYRYIR